jgi:predicted metal-dependent phosphotriesterase family hydrolase
MEIIEILAETGAILATGHLSAEESTTLAREALKRRVAKVVVTHPEHYYTQMPVTLQQKLAGQGVFFDRCYPSARTSPVTMEEMAQRIRLVGVESTVLTTDLGQPESPYPVDGLRSYLEQLATQGLSARELDTMVRSNPATLLGLS